MKKFLLALSLALVLTVTLPLAVCNANSAPPPSIIIGVTGAPDSLSLSIGDVTAERKDKPFMTYFIFKQWELPLSVSGLQVTSPANTFEVPISTNKTFNNYFTLDLDSQALTSVSSLPGVKNVPFLMVALTLLIEGVVFYLFGYRQRRSWLIFVVVNLLTQAWLINMLGNGTALADAYALLDLIVLEIGVFIAEMIAFGILLRERGPLRRISYVFTANILSLFVGGYIIWVFAI